MSGECQVNVKSQSELDIGGRETCSNTNIRIVLFGIWYSIIFKNRIYSVFGIRSFLKNRIYSVFGIRSFLTIRENTGLFTFTFSGYSREFYVQCAEWILGN